LQIVNALARRRRSGRRRLVWAAAALAALGLAALLAFEDALDTLDKVASVLSLVLAVGTLLWSSGPARSAAASPASFVDAPGAVLDALADRNLARAWDEEWRRRQLHDPAPLPVAWSNDDALADHWQNTAERTTRWTRLSSMASGTSSSTSSTGSRPAGW
jgi:hypothetical protein